jgi:hypothetical protein
MPSLQSFLSVVHLIGLALGLGCATAKLSLLLRSRTDQEFGPTFIKASKPITRLIIVGLSLLTLSGIGWLLLGYSFTPILIAKLALVAVIWILGPIIDNVVEPKFKQLAPGPGGSASPDFLRIQRRYLVMEITATALFYVITAMWVLT